MIRWISSVVEKIKWPEINIFRAIKKPQISVPRPRIPQVKPTLSVGVRTWSQKLGLSMASALTYLSTIGITSLFLPDVSMSQNLPQVDPTLSSNSISTELVDPVEEPSENQLGNAAVKAQAIEPSAQKEDPKVCDEMFRWSKEHGDYVRLCNLTHISENYVHTVREGQTLDAILKELTELSGSPRNYELIASFNRSIESPYVIFPGQKIEIPWRHVKSEHINELVRRESRSG